MDDGLRQGARQMKRLPRILLNVLTAASLVAWFAVAVPKRIHQRLAICCRCTKSISDPRAVES
jgi:hypothetical protein